MLSIEEIKNLALLARIELSAREEKELQKELGAILDYVGQLKKAPIKEVKSSQKISNVFREDEPINDKSEIKKGEHIRVKHIF
jgi:aspartyl/glutamyl-tRNA(Asn/Gln) amidotransferase C subunit